MFLSLGDLGLGADASPASTLQRGSTARGSFTAQLPKAPYGLKWSMIPGSGFTPPEGGLSTYEYMLTKAPADWNPPVKVETPAEDVKPTTPKPATLAPRPYAPPSAPLMRVPLAVRSPWYKRPVVLAGIGVGVVLTGITAVLSMRK